MKRESYLMRSIQRQYRMNLIVAIIISFVAGAIVHTFT